jgi:hypothetical protein
MALPRVFVSSTYYDLKYVRSSLEVFLNSLGFDAILSEKGSIAYSPDLPLDESCYREVQNADIFVLIVGGRYGSEASSASTHAPKTFLERYESITKKEYAAAVAKDLPIYVLAERAVYTEYSTFERNRENTAIQYAHVDSVNVFRFLAEILAQPRNNPVQTFEKYSEIEEWLRSQWAGLFRELLHRRSNQAQLTSLGAQVAELGEVNKTLRRYLEQVVTKVAPDDSVRLIRSESKRLHDARTHAQLRKNDLYDHLIARGIPPKVLRSLISKSASVATFIQNAEAQDGLTEEAKKIVRHLLSNFDYAREDLNRGRLLLGFPPLTDLVAFSPPPNDSARTVAPSAKPRRQAI